MRYADRTSQRRTVYMKHKTFPNYALMKFRATHKAAGIPSNGQCLCHYDRVYSSKVFDFTPENLYLPPDTIRGDRPGYDDIPLNQKLPPEIDAAFFLIQAFLPGV